MAWPHNDSEYANDAFNAERDRLKRKLYALRDDRVSQARELLTQYIDTRRSELDLEPMRLGLFMEGWEQVMNDAWGDKVLVIGRGRGFRWVMKEMAAHTDYIVRKVGGYMVERRDRKYNDRWPD